MTYLCVCNKPVSCRMWHEAIRKRGWLESWRQESVSKRTVPKTRKDLRNMRRRWGRARIPRFKSPVLTGSVRESREVVCTTSCINHTWPSHAAYFNSTVFCSAGHPTRPTYYSLLILLQRNGRQSQACLLRGSSLLVIRPPAHMSEHVPERLTP